MPPRKRAPRKLDTPVLDATNAAIAAAPHLQGQAGKPYAGTIEAARKLAAKIDAWDRIVQYALEDSYENETRPAVPQNDNVSLASYLKYMNDLGLTPVAQNTIPKKETAPTKQGGKLASVSGIPRPKTG